MKELREEESNTPLPAPGEIKVELWDADESCEHDYAPLGWSGVKCTKCGGWYCF